MELKTHVNFLWFRLGESLRHVKPAPTLVDDMADLTDYFHRLLRENPVAFDSTVELQGFAPMRLTFRAVCQTVALVALPPHTAKDKLPDALCLLVNGLDAFTEERVTFGGHSPAEVARALTALPVQAIGANCSVGSSVLYDVLVLLRDAAPGIPVSVQPNAGLDRNAPDPAAARSRVIEAAEASLRRLRTDHIDVYQLHAIPYDWAELPVMQALATLQQEGKVRWYGISTNNQEAAERLRAHGPIHVMQIGYNLLDRSTEWELIPVCENEGLGVIPWSPLRGGWLSGKFRRGMTTPGEGTRIKTASEQGWSESWEKYNNEHTWTVLDALFVMADDTGKSPAQIAINWLLRQPGVTAPIIGARTSPSWSAATRPVIERSTTYARIPTSARTPTSSSGLRVSGHAINSAASSIGARASRWPSAFASCTAGRSSPATRASCLPRTTWMGG